MDLLLILLGVALLYAGGEGLVRGASALGQRLGLTPMVIGLTVVSFGTSSPELAASLAAVLKGSPAVSFGNIVGSNIANLGLVLGATAAIWPLAVAAKFLQREMPFLVLISLSMFWSSQTSKGITATVSSDPTENVRCSKVGRGTWNATMTAIPAIVARRI